MNNDEFDTKEKTVQKIIAVYQNKNSKIPISASIIKRLDFGKECILKVMLQSFSSDQYKRVRCIHTAI